MARNSVAVATIWLAAPSVTQKKNARVTPGGGPPVKAHTTASHSAANGAP
jgi:hypothetical protein